MIELSEPQRRALLEAKRNEESQESTPDGSGAYFSEYATVGQTAVQGLVDLGLMEWVSVDDEAGRWLARLTDEGRRRAVQGQTGPRPSPGSAGRASDG